MDVFYKLSIPPMMDSVQRNPTNIMLLTGNSSLGDINWKLFTW